MRTRDEDAELVDVVAVGTDDDARRVAERRRERYVLAVAFVAAVVLVPLVGFWLADARAR